MYNYNRPYNNRYNPGDSRRKSYYQDRYPYRGSQDHGPDPFVTNINEAALHNNTFRTALWTGEYLQLTLMSIDVCDDIGLEMHSDVDQFLRLEQGQGLVMMGEDKNNLCYQKRVAKDYVIFVPAGIWHNLINTGNVPIKLYSIYAPPNHPHGTIHVTKEDDIH
ncbi:MAG: cupin domain-containing protein [Herbinix sp.]|nr:cupin domain-containing protein [Herbinix sp.]